MSNKPPSPRSGLLILVVGPSGAGKDFLVGAAREALVGDTRFRFVRRDITRPAEAGGEDHRACSSSEFAALREAGAYALHWSAHGLEYGIPADVAGDLAAGLVVVANVSRGTIADAALRFPVRVLEITAPAPVLAARLAARGREDAADIAARLARHIALPDGIEVVTVVNDATIAEGRAAVVAALTRAGKTVPRS